jgi:hypothetical protein
MVAVLVQGNLFFLHIAVDDLTMANPRCTAFRLISSGGAVPLIFNFLALSG